MLTIEEAKILIWINDTDHFTSEWKVVNKAGRVVEVNGEPFKKWTIMRVTGRDSFIDIPSTLVEKEYFEGTLIKNRIYVLSEKGKEALKQFYEAHNV